MQYGKLNEDRQLEYAPINFITEDGKVILNFAQNEKLMSEYGFKPVEDTPCPEFNREFQIAKSQWQEQKQKIVKIWTVSDDLQKLGNYLVARINEKYEADQENLIAVNEYFVKTSWFGTYTNVYQALKFAEDAGLSVDPSNVIVCTKDCKFTNIEVTSSNDMRPLYEATMLSYRQLISKRNDLLVKVQNAKNKEDLQQVLSEIM